jgi:hypothetical protein
MAEKTSCFLKEDEVDKGRLEKDFEYLYSVRGFELTSTTVRASWL